ncbi:hypothetical protein GUITHDRAFT_76077, partial [Guillardia theta CCMP2712]
MKCYIKLNVLLVLLALCLPTGSGEATDAANSEATGNGLQFATAGILAQFTVTSKDESGVRRTSGGDEWIVEFAGTRSLTGSVVDNLDGTYQVSYTATKSGSYEVSVLLAKSGAGTCSAKSFATPNQAEPGNSLELSTAGVQAEFSITAKDLYGNLRGIGGDNFKVRLTGVDSSAGIVQDFLNGTYRVTYTTTVSGTYDISVVFGASGIYQSPFRMV